MDVNSDNKVLVEVTHFFRESNFSIRDLMYASFSFKVSAEFFTLLIPFYKSCLTIHRIAQWTKSAWHYYNHVETCHQIEKKKKEETNLMHYFKKNNVLQIVFAKISM